MGLLKILILAAVQGAAELLPVSSSAHVIVAERLMGLDPSSPAMTFLLVMLHTGTMFAVLFYFWPRWKKIWAGKKGDGSKVFLRNIAIATLITGVLGMGAKKAIEKFGHIEVEELFNSLPLVAANLLAVGILILVSSRFDRKGARTTHTRLSDKDSAVIGVVQSICLPLRGFSRSGATISAALMRGISRTMAEEFSFALAVVLTPPVVLLELKRLLKSGGAQTHEALHGSIASGLLGMILSFIAGLLALRLLSSWLEAGKWRYFGIYCLAASGAVFALHSFGGPFG